MTDAPDSFDLETQAGEYVAGTLDAAERAAFVRRLAGDPRARTAVAAWRARLEPLLATAPDVEPPAGAWAGIERRIGPAASNDNRDGGVAPAWRGLAIAASVLAAIGGVAALRPSPAPVAVPAVMPVGASYVAAVTAGGAEPALLVTIDAKTGKAMVRAIGLTPPARKSLELWYIGAGRDPRSMGLVRGDMKAEMALKDMIARGDRLDASRFAVTVEPAGGAPGGVPTGDILYSGRVMPVSGT